MSYLIIQNYEELMQTSFQNQKLELQADYIRQSSDMIQQVRKERHELKNNYFYIQSLVKEEKYDALNAFLNEEMQQRYPAFRAADPRSGSVRSAHEPAG